MKFARADTLTKNGDHKKTRFFIEDGIARAAATTGTFVRIRLFSESLPIMCFFTTTRLVWPQLLTHAHARFARFSQKSQIRLASMPQLFFAVQDTEKCCSKRDRCSATGVLLRTGHGTAVAGRIVQVAGEPISGKFRSRHVFCTVLLRGFTILEKLMQFLKNLCFFLRSSGACPASTWGSASSRR